MGYHEKPTPKMKICRDRSVSHDLALSVGLGSIHVDIHVVAIGGTLFDTLAILLKLLILVLALALEIDAAILRHLVLLDDVLTLTVCNACHSLVAVAVGSALAVSVGGALLDIVLEANLLGAVLLLLDVDVSLGLVGGELGRSSSIVVPGQSNQSMGDR